MNKKQKEVLQSCLDIESRTLKGLKQTYKQALRDCNQKIRELSSRTDMENLQSVIYQKQYQEALKGQLEGVMANLQSGAYAKISDYLAQCYQNGFVGTMYDLAGQGIPLIIPVDKNAIAKAIQLKSKLSKSLYDRLGEDVGALKKSVSSELSRGIAAGLTWNEVAGNMSRSFKHTPFNRAYNNSVRIARTEGHRVQVQSTMDAQRKAKSKGADMVKQWDATLDSATRDAHRELDGKIAEIDDDFKWSGGSVSAPGMFGDPAQDCNCRCALLSRARWALDDDELKTLQDRATYFGIDKSEDFEDYKKKYLGISKEDVEKYYGGIPKTWKTMEPDDEAAKNANPNYKFYLYNEYAKNCPNCAVAYEMRKRGYDVVAKPYTKRGSHYLNANPWAAWENADVKNVSSYNELLEIAKNSSDGTRFGICYLRNDNIGHVIVGEANNGNLKLYDAQSGKGLGALDFDAVHDVKLWKTNDLKPSDRGITACEGR